MQPSSDTAMTTEYLRTLLQEGEKEWLEYKAELPHNLLEKVNKTAQLEARGTLFKDLQALANARSDRRIRYMIVGVKDLRVRREVVGIETKLDGSDFLQWTRPVFQPQIRFEVEFVDIDDKCVLVFLVKAADELLVAEMDFETKLRCGQVWYRVGPQNLVAGREVLLEFLANERPAEEVLKRLIFTRLMAIAQWHHLDLVRFAGVLSGFGFTAGVLSDAQLALNELNDEAVEFICEHFLVNREWLMGLSDIIDGTEQMWSKRNREFGQRVLELIAAQQLQTVYVVKSRDFDLDTSKSRDDEDDEIGLVLVIGHRLVSGEYQTFERWGFEPFLYQRTREELLGIVWFLTTLARNGGGGAARGYPQGVAVAQADFEALFRGEIHIAQLLHERVHHRRWYPHDLLGGLGELPQEVAWREGVMELLGRDAVAR
jgi:hypothetical protein